MKKIIFLLSISLGLFATEGFAQTKPSKKELLQLWKKMNPEQQAQFLSNSRQWVDALEKNAAAAKVNTASTAEAAPKVEAKNKAAAKDQRTNATQVAPVKATEEKKEVAKVATASKPAPQISVQPAKDAVKPADNQPLVLAPSNSPMVAAPATTTPEDNRPDYLKRVESMAKTTVKWDSELFDFGKIKQGEVAKHTFKFTNTGKAPLLISYVKPSCGCTTPNWTKEEVAPGAEGMVEIHFNTTGKSGNQQKSITVFANTEPVILSLQFKGEIIAATTPAPTDGHNHEGHNHEGHNH